MDNRKRIALVAHDNRKKDLKALLRIAMVYNITTACNRATADHIISSLLFAGNYKPILKDYSSYIMRDILQ